MGGGRRNFLKKEAGSPGLRIDNRNLIQEWEQKMIALKKTHKYVTNLTSFRDLKPNQYEHLLGRCIFAMKGSHQDIQLFV